MDSFLRQILAEPLSKAHGTFQVICAEVSRSWNRSINREVVAQTLGIHPQHITRLVKRFTGKTFNAYLSDQRLARAASMLKEGGAFGIGSGEKGVNSCPFRVYWY